MAWVSTAQSVQWMVGFWTTCFRFPRRVGNFLSIVIRTAREASLVCSLSQLAGTFFAASVWGGVKRSDREADYLHSGPRLRMHSDRFRWGSRKPFKARLLWRNVIVDVTSLYFTHTPLVQLSQQTLIVDPDSRNMRCGSSDVYTESANVKKCVRLRLELVNGAQQPLGCVLSRWIVFPYIYIYIYIYSVTSVNSG